MIQSVGKFAPAEMLTLIREQMVRIAEGNHGGILSVGLLGALWSSSAALVAIIGAMNKAYDIDESRPWWKVRLLAIGLTVGLAVFIVVSFGLVVAGPQLADWLAAKYGFGGMFVWTWKILQWPVAFALVATGIGLIYYFAPDADQDFAWITPGSLMATTLWLLGSLGFRFYVINFGNYESYGAVAGVILLMLWFYLSAFVIILGAEVSAEIEHASPWGKAPAEKVPGRRKKLGHAAGLEFRARASQPAVVSVTPAAPDPLIPSHDVSQPAFAAWVGAAVLLVLGWRRTVKQ